MAQDRHLTTEQLSAYLDKQLSAQEQAAFDVHLQSCQQCQNVLDDLRQTVALLHALPQPVLPRSFVLPAEVIREAAPSAPVAAMRTSAPAPLHIDEGRRHVEQRAKRRQYVLRRTLRAMSTIAAVIGFIFLLTAIPIPLHAGGASTSSGTSGGAASAPANNPNASASAQPSTTMGTHTAAGQNAGTAPAKGTPNSGPTPTPTSQLQNGNQHTTQQSPPAPVSDILQNIGAALDPTVSGGRALDGLLLLALAILGFVLSRIWRSARTT